MTTTIRKLRLPLLVVLLLTLVASGVQLYRTLDNSSRRHVTAYFATTNGVYVGDDVRIRGVNVGKIESIEPEPNRVKVTLWFNDHYSVPADAKAVILSPTLVTARAIQLTPPYRGGPLLANNAVIDEKRTASPLEWDDFRDQLQKLSQSLQPLKPGGVSALGGLINTAADNLRGQGAAIHDAIVKLSQAISVIDDRREDAFSSIKGLARLTSALNDSTSLITMLNSNLATVSGLLATQPQAIATALKDFSSVIADVRSFLERNRESLGVASEKLDEVTTAAAGSLDDIQQLLHVLPNTLANVANLYQPAQGTLSAAAVLNNFSDPITFLCGAIQAASRLGAEQSAKLCVQYLAPIVKNRQYNFPPLGINPIVGAAARPNEITYSEPWMRPDYVPPSSANTQSAGPLLPAEAAPAGTAPAATPTNPAAGLPGLMTPMGGGS